MTGGSLIIFDCFFNVVITYLINLAPVGNEDIMSKHNSELTAYVQQEEGYRTKALRMYPWICRLCAREFEYSNYRELTVHHIDHNHSHNPLDGSNWQRLDSPILLI